MADISSLYVRILGEITTNPGQTVQQLSLASKRNRKESFHSMADEVDSCKLGEIDPLMISGKNDRLQLQQLIVGLSEQQLGARSLDVNTKGLPSIQIEKRLQQAWSTVLGAGVDSIGINENFFDSGGDSMLAMSLVVAARSFGIHITVADIFTHSTLSDLSLFITATEMITDTQVGISPYASSGSSEKIESDLQDSSLQCAAYQNSLEMRALLQQIWAEALNIQTDSFEVNDNFFDLGGDSISAMRVVAASRSAGIHISVADIFGHPTLLGISQTSSIPIRLDQSIQESGHSPFSSLDFHDIEGFLEGVVCPQVGFERSNIEDALTATNMQADMIGFGFSRARGNIHYFTFDFDGYIDPQRLETACQTLISHHPILRTVFFAYKSQVFQIVLRSVPLEFQQYPCENSVEDLSKHLVSTDKCLPFGPGDRILRFMFLNRRSSGSRLILRVSHTQYDGICFPTITKDPETAYLGENMEFSPPFSDFLHAIKRRNGTEAEGYWQALLKNASMTSFSRYKTPTYENYTDSVIMRSILYTSLKSYGITLASLIKASWAFVLAQFSGESDIVFGHVVSGRNLPLEGIDQIVGPCVNIIPVRVRLASSTVLGLLRLVQNQHLESIPYETMGFQRIVEQCTEWPRWTRFGSVVQHQNLKEILTACRFGDTNCKIGAISSPHDIVDVAIFSSLQGKRTEVSLHFSKKFVPLSFAKEILEVLCATILQFSKDVNAQLPLPSSWSTVPPRIPLSSVNEVQARCDTKPIKAMPACQSIVERAWKSVIKVGDGDCADKLCDPNIPFFIIWGALTAAAQLSAFYKREGILIEINEILHHPTIYLQILLVAQRLGEK